jgi:hypothetical protein
MLTGVGESVVIRVRRPVAPGQRESLRGGGDGGFRVALVALDLGEDVQGISVKERIPSAFGG